MRTFPCIVSSEDKHQVFSLGSNCKHNCRTKIDAASSDRPFSPSNNFFNAKADRQRQFSSIVYDEDKHKVRPLLTIKITGQTKHTQLRSIACISPGTSFKRMEETINFSWTTVFPTKLFFWQVCVCSAKGGTPLDPRFSFLSASSLIESSCHFSFFSLVSEHSARRF